MQLMLDGARAAGLKLTPQRIAVVRELAGDESHPTAQELYDRLRHSLPTMSFATVYNTLDALAAAGLCSAMSLAPGSGRFDPNMAPHHHVVCDGCGGVRDLPAGALADSRAGAASIRSVVARAAPGFELRSVERIFRGLCASCAGAAQSTAVGSAGTRRRSNARSTATHAVDATHATHATQGGRPTWQSSREPRRTRT